MAQGEHQGDIVAIVIIVVLCGGAALAALAGWWRTRRRLAARGRAWQTTLREPFAHTFGEGYITLASSTAFAAEYADAYAAATTLARQMKRHLLAPSPVLTAFINDYSHLQSHIARRNEQYMRRVLAEQKTFFDTCLTQPLDAQQRRAVATEEDNCLVVSAAGSGKTSAIVARTRYLINVKGVPARHILLISFTNKAARELTARVGVASLRGYTFHKLAVDIIARLTGTKPSICDNTDKVIENIYHSLLKDALFCRAGVSYLVNSYSAAEHDDALPARRCRLRALLPDMDGQAIYVRSEEEKAICYALSSLGVAFRYEEPYEYAVADAAHSQYKPDFSIYYRAADGTQRRIYLEHYGVDEHSRVPEWFATESGLTYSEANKRYNDGITWKKLTHAKYGTTLLTTSSADFRAGDICATLSKRLAAAGVPCCKLSDETLLARLVPTASREERSLLRLLATFVTLMKSCCQTPAAVLAKAQTAQDARAVSVIQSLFLPVYERYEAALRASKQIDFTDAILWATALCQQTPPHYEHIIVDEFQDISVDRYRFLQALRGTPPARLFCVGDDWQSIYRFAGSDVALFQQFDTFFGAAERDKLETTYRFGEPLARYAARFILRNKAQIEKVVQPADPQRQTLLTLQGYDKGSYLSVVAALIAAIPDSETVLLLGRYSFDAAPIAAAGACRAVRERCFYTIGGREIEFLTIHKAKGLEADNVVLLQCNAGLYGFPSLVRDDPALQYLLCGSETMPFAEERRLFYVALTRARRHTWVLYDKRSPSPFVREMRRIIAAETAPKGRRRAANANKPWTRREDALLLAQYAAGQSIAALAQRLGRSPYAIRRRLEKLNT